MQLDLFKEPGTGRKPRIEKKTNPKNDAIAEEMIQEIYKKIAAAEKANQEKERKASVFSIKDAMKQIEEEETAEKNNKNIRLENKEENQEIIEK